MKQALIIISVIFVTVALTRYIIMMDIEDVLDQKLDEFYWETLDLSKETS